MTLFVRATLATLLLAMGWSPALIAQTAASACIDTDGDGYGWNGFETCDPAAGSSNGNNGLIPTNNAPALACLDTDGDGYGWNGFETCDPNASAPAPQDDAPTAQACIDSDGDGFGWNGSATCIPDGSGSNPGNAPQDDAPSAQACIDSDGDGFGWNGVATCIPDGSEVADNDTGSDTGNDAGDNGDTDNSGSGNNSGNGTTYTSTFFPIGNVAADQCLTRQDALGGNYPGSITAGDFILSINAWNFGAAGGYNWEQCIFANNSALGWTYDWGAGGGPSDFNVRSYPELIFGVKSGGEISGDSSREGTGLPVRVDNLPDITIDYSFTSNETGPARATQASVTPRFPNGSTIFGERNIAVESFFHPSDANGNCPASVVQRGNGQSNHTYEMMVWLDSGAERLPAGPSGYVTTINLDGGTYDVYTKNNDLKYVAFVRTNPSLTGTINWTSFIEWTRNNAHRVTQLYGAQTNSVELQGNWCLANILVGNEIWWGAGDFTINQWQINRSY